MRLLASASLLFLLWRLCLLLPCAHSVAPSVFRAQSPYVSILSPSPSVKLLLIDANETLDTDNGYFTLAVDVLAYYATSPTPVSLPRATLYGNVTFAPPSLMLFGFPATTSTYCYQSSLVFPSLCPLLQQYVNGPFNFGAYPASGATTALILEEQPYVNPSTGQAMNFLFASQALTWQCNGTCVDLHTLVPQSSVLSRLIVWFANKISLF